jgi:DnaJ-domain-containing protein 1
LLNIAADPMARVPFDPATDYYQLLGVGPTATPEEIQAAYRRLAKAYHPDLNAGSEAAAARMARVNVAKSVLLDHSTRATYDRARGLRSAQAEAVAAAVAQVEHSTVRYAPHQTAPRARHRVVSSASARAAPRSTFDRGTGVLLLIAVPLIAALCLYIFQAVQVSIEPLKVASADAILAPGQNTHSTARGAADAVFSMVRAEPPSRELALRANNLILARSDSTPESELLRADGRRLLRSANVGDAAGWEAAVGDICQLAARC